MLSFSSHPQRLRRCTQADTNDPQRSMTPQRHCIPRRRMYSRLYIRPGRMDRHPSRTLRSISRLLASAWSSSVDQRPPRRPPRRPPLRRPLRRPHRPPHPPHRHPRQPTLPSTGGWLQTAFRRALEPVGACPRQGIAGCPRRLGLRVPLPMVPPWRPPERFAVGVASSTNEAFPRYSGGIAVAVCAPPKISERQRPARERLSAALLAMKRQRGARGERGGRGREGVGRLRWCYRLRTSRCKGAARGGRGRRGEGQRERGEGDGCDEEQG